jgi:hypothetical protein
MPVMAVAWDFSSMVRQTRVTGGAQMTRQQLLKAVAAGTGLAVILATWLFTGSRGARADDGDSEESKIQQGFAIAPVPLNLAGKDRALVGLGSYIVNAQADCNGCHNAGPGGASGYLPNGNPYLLSPPFGPFLGTKVVNQATYLGGGRDFGPLVPGSFDFVSRNLTPDKTGRPEGGHTLSEFIQIIRTGVDMDHLHPTCSGAVNTGCVPVPFNGAELQIMPWPAYKDMTDHDLQAIYEYLSAIPCVAGPPAPDPRHNDCQ